MSNQNEMSTKCFAGTTRKCASLKKIGDHKLYKAKDLILATKDHLVDLHLLLGYGNDTGITENKLTENRYGI